MKPLKRILKILQQFFCEHEPEVKYLSIRFQVRDGDVVHQWVCQCKNCGLVICVDSGRRVL